MQAALERELVDTEAKLAREKAEAANPTTATGGGDGDSEMAGVEEQPANGRADDEVSEAGSEDLEAESSGSEEEDEEDEGEGEGEGEGDEDMEMGEDEEKNNAETTNGEQKNGIQQQQGNPEVMVH